MAEQVPVPTPGRRRRSRRERCHSRGAWKAQRRTVTATGRTPGQVVTGQSVIRTFSAGLALRPASDARRPLADGSPPSHPEAEEPLCGRHHRRVALAQQGGWRRIWRRWRRKAWDRRRLRRDRRSVHCTRTGPDQLDDLKHAASKPDGEAGDERCEPRQAGARRQAAVRARRAAGHTEGGAVPFEPQPDAPSRAGHEPGKRSGRRDVRSPSFHPFEARPSRRPASRQTTPRPPGRRAGPARRTRKLPPGRRGPLLPPTPRGPGGPRRDRRPGEVRRGQRAGGRRGRRPSARNLPAPA